MVDIDLFWKNAQLEMDAAITPVVCTPFSPEVFNDFEIGGSSHTPLVLEEGKDKNLLLQQLQCISFRLRLPGATEINFWEDRLKMCQNLFTRLCLIKYKVCR